MKKIICESQWQEKIIFTYEFPFCLESVEGLHEVIGSVSGTKSAFAVGENYIDTSVEKRNIVINGIIKNNFIDNRNKIYRTFPLKTLGTLYYYEGKLARKINYRVESVRVSEKGFPRVFQISLICHNPYFTDIEKTVLQMATWSPAFKFPLKIQNEGIKFGVKNKTSMAIITNNTNIEFGITIIFKANDIVENPSLFNVDSREQMKIEKIMNPGDKIIVSTNRQNKNIIYIPADTGTEENINNLMVYGSKFLQVHHGTNTFRHAAERNEENLETIIEYYFEYEAV